ncbi:hypothetical protein HMPREF0682_1529 [Propionibacterium acidifaciens F0233]|uniref:Uncharacterized protein n=1 Tax=Propionibacterium acidifaciens F0233 TaxID=553198 RepID=U2QQS5_9ACTN|nr:hypothetical protein HMPREF0682_1529 [Propionibacterium acidifaciens F0233]
MSAIPHDHFTTVRKTPSTPGSDWCSASDRIFMTSRIAGTSQNPARTPVREGGRVRMVLSPCSCARVGFAAS